MVKIGITKECIIEDLDEISNILDIEIDKCMKSLDKNKSTRCLKKIKKRIDRLKRDVPRIKKKINRDDYSNSGFTKKMSISKELTSFLGVDKDTKLSRDDIQSALCTYINIKPNEAREKMTQWSYLNKEGRDLRDPTNKKIIIPDDKLAELLHYNEYCKQSSTDNKLYYYVLMKLIQPHFR